MATKHQPLTQAERRALLLLAIIALLALAAIAAKSCSTPAMPEAPSAIGASADSISSSTTLPPDTISVADTTQTLRKHKKAKRKTASSAYKERNILDETL